MSVMHHTNARFPLPLTLWSLVGLRLSLSMCAFPPGRRWSVCRERFVKQQPSAKAPLLFAPRNVRPKNQPNRATTPGYSVRSGGASGLRCSTAEEVAEVAAAHLGWPSISPPGHRARRPLHDGRVWARGQTPLPPQRGRLPQAGVCPTLARR